jgi:hypothetical protein
VDQRLLVESSQVPLAVVNGGKDPFVNLGYFDNVAYANFFDPILERFLQDVETGRASTCHKD